MRRRARILRQDEHGVSLVSALFLLVVLAALGALAVRVNVLQQQTVGSGLRATEAFHAARSGVAWAAYRAINGGWCGTATLNLGEGGAAGFSVTVSCSESTHAEGSATVHVYVIDALAEAGAYGGPDYVSRRLQAKFTRET